MFLRHMVRVLVGTMLDVATGIGTVAEFTELLEGRPRSHGGRTAPAHGLALASVSYDRELSRPVAHPPPAPRHGATPAAEADSRCRAGRG